MTTEAASLGDALDRVARSLAHDLRAPLRAIDGYAFFIGASASVLDPPSRDNLARIRQAAHQLDAVLSRVLEYVSLYRRPLQPEPVDLTALARKVAASKATAAPARAVPVDVAEGMEAFGDAAAIEMVLSELIDNARKFTASAPEPRITVGPAGPHTFFVRDNGAGFAGDEAANLFVAFERLHPWGDYEGDGAGLAIVHQLVSRHGGEVWAEGCVDAGASFYFSLPAPDDADADTDEDMAIA